MRQFLYVSIISIIIIFLIVNLYYNKKEDNIIDEPIARENVKIFPFISGTDEEKEIYKNENAYSKEKRYRYRITISNVQREWETYETQEMINGEVRLRKTSPDISYLNGTYDWYSDIYLPDENAMFNYIYDNYEFMKYHKR